MWRKKRSNEQNRNFTFPSHPLQNNDVKSSLFCQSSGNRNADGSFYTFLFEPEHCLHKFLKKKKSSHFNRYFPRLRTISTRETYWPMKIVFHCISSKPITGGSLMEFYQSLYFLCCHAHKVSGLGSRMI